MTTLATAQAVNETLGLPMMLDSRLNVCRHFYDTIEAYSFTT